MRMTSKLACLAAAATMIGLTISAADARWTTRDHFNGAYAWTGNGAPPVGRDFVYGANRAPYGADEDNPRDFQLQGR